MEENKREKFYFERDQHGQLTGLTVCNIDGVLGFASCYPGKVVTHNSCLPSGLRQMVVTEVCRPDSFNRKVGKEIAKGRAQKLAELLAEGVTEREAVASLYSGRMQTRILEYADREIIRQANAPALVDELPESTKPNQVN